MAIDWLPTLTELVGGRPPERRIDGRSALPLLLGRPDAREPHEHLFFFSGTALHAVSSGPWKLHFPHPYLTVAAEPGRGGKPSNFGRLAPRAITQSGVDGIASRHGYRVEQLGLSLFHLEDDPGETRDVAAAHPDVVRRLQAAAEAVRGDLGDSLTGAKGTGLRPAGIDSSP
jgi:arylsulfatase